MIHFYIYVLRSNIVLRNTIFGLRKYISVYKMVLSLLWCYERLRNSRDPVSASQATVFQFSGLTFRLGRLLFVLRVSWKVKPSAGNIVPQKHLYRTRIDDPCPWELIRDQITISLRSYLRSKWDWFQDNPGQPNVSRLWTLIFCLRSSEPLNIFSGNFVLRN